ncbi:Ig-like domain-containing protein [Pseudarthrobacter sp. PS3-L1]|uniref:L,D-transpeptidase n=1 Tax=Pseudarthrobacter sp. PS3-L1 TaxID=3046207 RepID=UPI0024BB92CD|nr:Ig-like domain-containing protein [Pseudarthrobacter sp. PS3-L1]MDJ0319645.1 Ig-like domain-containing protein [Pseudarthrobacter sp. PS3-L1]
MEPDTKPHRLGSARKIILIVGVCALIVGGGVFAATSGVGADLVQSVAAPNSRPSAAPSTASPSEPPAAPPVQLVASPVNGAAQVNPAAPVTLSAKGGTLETVSLANAAGEKVAGSMGADDLTWTASEPLLFDSTYTLASTVKDAAGKSSTSTSSFSTVPAANEADAAIYPLDGMNVGVGQPLQIVFSEPVVNREAVEKAISVTTTAGQQGAFHWYSDTMVRYRPEAFWTANTTVTMDMKLFGLDIGNGQIANFNKTLNVNIGDKRVAVADATAHTFTLSINDQVIKTVPATMGDERFPSANGFAVLMEKNRYDHFRAASIGLKPGDPAFYGELDVEHTIRLSLSGAYIHQALESAYSSLGNANVSHGCIGLGPVDAAWVFDTMQTGDVVQVINTDGEYAAPTDGFQDWNIPWADYAN